MRSIIPILFLIIVLAACRGAENKADHSTSEPTRQDTMEVPKNTDTSSKKGSPTPAQSGQSREPASAIEPSEILSKIDTHLISSAKYDLGPSGGIINGLVTITNTLADVSFQKALLEVTVQKADGSFISSNFYTVVNIEPKGSKAVKIPNTSSGEKLSTKIVKVKSNELTKGEWVLSGSHYTPN